MLNSRFVFHRLGGCSDPFLSPYNDLGKNSSSAPPPPDYSGLAAASDKSAEIMGKLGTQQNDEARRQFNINAAVAAPIVDQQIGIAKQNQQIAVDDRNYYNSTSRPVQTGLYKEFMGDTSPVDYYDYKAGTPYTYDANAKGPVQSALERYFQNGSSGVPNMASGGASGAAPGLSTSAQNAAVATTDPKQAAWQYIMSNYEIDKSRLANVKALVDSGKAYQGGNAIRGFQVKNDAGDVVANLDPSNFQNVLNSIRGLDAKGNWNKVEGDVSQKTGNIAYYETLISNSEAAKAKLEEKNRDLDSNSAAYKKNAATIAAYERNIANYTSIKDSRQATLDMYESAARSAGYNPTKNGVGQYVKDEDWIETLAAKRNAYDAQYKDELAQIMDSGGFTLKKGSELFKYRERASEKVKWDAKEAQRKADAEAKGEKYEPQEFQYTTGGTDGWGGVIGGGKGGSADGSSVLAKQYDWNAQKMKGQDEAAGRASAAVQQGLATQRDATVRQMRGMGMNMTSPAALAAIANFTKNAGLQEANAVNAARDGARRERFATGMSLAGLGNALPGWSNAAYGTANTAGNSATQNQNQPGQQYLNGAAQGAQMTGQGLGYQMNGLSSIANGQNQAYIAGLNQPSAAGGLLGAAANLGSAYLMRPS